MLNRTYNNIIRIIGFLATVFVIVAKILGWTDASWWIVWIPIVLTLVFGNKDEEHIYLVKNAEEIEEIENINEDDVEHEEPSHGGPNYGI